MPAYAKTPQQLSAPPSSAPASKFGRPARAFPVRPAPPEEAAEPESRRKVAELLGHSLSRMIGPAGQEAQPQERGAGSVVQRFKNPLKPALRRFTRGLDPLEAIKGALKGRIAGAPGRGRGGAMFSPMSLAAMAAFPEVGALEMAEPALAGEAGPSLGAARSAMPAGNPFAGNPFFQAARHGASSMAHTGMKLMSNPFLGFGLGHPLGPFGLLGGANPMANAAGMISFGGHRFAPGTLNPAAFAKRIARDRETLANTTRALARNPVNPDSAAELYEKAKEEPSSPSAPGS